MSAHDRDDESSGLLWGCLAIVGVLGVLALGLGIWIFVHGRDFAANQVESIVSDVMQDAGIPPAEREPIEAEVAKLMDQFRAKEVEGGELAEFVGKLFEGPWRVLLLTRTIENEMEKLDDFPEEDAQNARRAFRRLDYAAHHDVIKLEVADALIEVAFGGSFEIGSDDATGLDADSLRAFTRETHENLDAADVPEDCPRIDLAESFRDVLNAHFSAPEMVPESAPEGEVPPSEDPNGGEA